jgi:hypothetical protein
MEKKMANKFDFLMISAGFEHGGNVTQRFLDGHEEMYVYPFESQLGNRNVNDYLSSLERSQYRYPEFPSNISAKEAYELFYDEELKTFLRKPNGSKFKTADIKMDENDRIEKFCQFLKDKPHTRANNVEAFFRSTFDAWTNYKVSGKNHIYVGYSPIIGIDADRILADFPSAHILHVVRNPFSAYADTKRRPFPLPIKQYAISWNLYHHIVLMHKSKFPNNVTILRYEDLIADSEKAFAPLCKAMNIKFSESMTYPSWNSNNISDNIYPWGTINSARPEENVAALQRLGSEEKAQINSYSKVMMDVFDYNAFATM